MPILNFGSLNIDHVYRVDSFVQPGETKHSKAYMVNSGSKGLNSLSRGKAGGQVLHAGLVGRDRSFGGKTARRWGGYRADAGFG